MSQFPSEVLDCLQCPRTGTSIQQTDSKSLTSEKDQYSYPQTMGISWLYPLPEQQIQQWQLRFIHMEQFFEQKIENLDWQSRHQGLSPLTTQRLEQLEKAYESNLQSIRSIRKEIFKDHSQSFENFEDQLQDALPQTQQVNSYLPNIFRDWSWKTDENKLSLEACKKVFPSLKDKNLVTFGAGACRLPLDLHTDLQPSWSLALDINPFLYYFADKAIKGEKTTFYDFPQSPLSLQDYAHEYELQSQFKAPPENFHLLFADAMNPPLKPSTIDTLFTPWFLDIVPQKPEDSIRKINNGLKTGGHWINFGPLGYSFNNEFQQLSIDELKELLPKCGFKLEVFEEPELPYLENPLSRQQRKEKLFCFRAIKEKGCKQPGYFNLHPEWILDTTIKIPLLKDVEEHKVTRQIQFEVLNCIDGQRSIDEITQLMQTHYQMTADQAKSSLIHFFSQLKLNK